MLNCNWHVAGGQCGHVCEEFRMWMSEQTTVHSYLPRAYNSLSNTVFVTYQRYLSPTICICYILAMSSVLGIDISKNTYSLRSICFIIIFFDMVSICSTDWPQVPASVFGYWHDHVYHTQAKLNFNHHHWLLPDCKVHTLFIIPCNQNNPLCFFDVRYLFTAATTVTKTMREE